MNLFELQAQISIGIENALSKLTQLGSKAGEVANEIQEGLGGSNPVNIDTSNADKSLRSLTNTIDKQENELKDLKTRYKEVCDEQGESSDEAQKLAREIDDLSNELNKNKKALNDAGKEADKFEKEIEDVGEASTKSSSKIGNFFSKLGSGVGKVAKVVGVGVGAAATAIGGLTVKAVSLAGDLEQNMGGSEAVFGKHAGKMQDTAKKAFENMGLSTSDYLATANKMGALFQGAGFDIEKSADISSKAMQRAADVASIMGIDTASAMESIAGAAKGNFTMMDNLGVAMNDTTLNAYALEKGINKTTQEMTNQEKISLAMEMFLEKTAYAAGNYAKENETLAGSLGTAKAAFSNFLSGSGNVDDVVKSFTNAGQVITKNVTELFPKLLTGLVQIFNGLVPMLPSLLGQLLNPLISGATQLINGLVSALPQLVNIIIDAFPTLLNGIVSIINLLIESLPQLVEMIVGALPTLIPALIDGIVSIIVTICEQFSSIIQPIIDALPEIVVSIVEALLNNLPILIKGVLQLIVGVAKAVPQLLTSLKNAFVEGFKLIWGKIKDVFSPLGDWFSKKFKEGKENATKAWSNVKSGFSKAWESIKSAFSNVGSWFKNQFEQGKKNAQQAWSTIKNFFSNIWSGIKNVFANVGSWFKDLFTKAKNNVLNSWSNVKAKFASIKDSIVNAFSNVKEKLTQPFTKARDAIKKVADKIKGFFKGTISMPKIKVPKFTIKPSGWKIGDLLKGSIPKLGITWAAKGGIFDKPTLFDTPTGKLGVGEAGAEAVAPIDTLLGYIRQVVRNENSELVYTLERQYTLLADYMPIIAKNKNGVVVLDTGALVGELVPTLDVKLGEREDARERGR